MAGNPPDDSPDVTLENTYKCHPKIKLKVVICIVCEDMYYPSDFQKELDNIFGVYSKNETIKLTSKQGENVIRTNARKNDANEIDLLRIQTSLLKE